MSYRAEADALDREIEDAITSNCVSDFDDLAILILQHQLRYNDPYARYCAAFGVTPDALPDSWANIPPVPAAAFKEAALCTFAPGNAALVFETSGTTARVAGTHYMESSRLYDAALLAGFAIGFLRGDLSPRRYFLLVPNPAAGARSSLGYMMQRAVAQFGDGQERWYLDGDRLDVDLFITEARRAIRSGTPVCIAATAFALVALLEALREKGVSTLPLPAGSRIMETGGFKGRTRVVERSELYAEVSHFFGISESSVIGEYGMTELTSQYYDAPAPDDPRAGPRVKVGPPWLQARVVGRDGETLPPGQVGALVHVDLANRSSCVAVLTEDVGVAVDGGFVLIGRERGAELRGCSLDTESLIAAAR